MFSDFMLYTIGVCNNSNPFTIIEIITCHHRLFSCWLGANNSNERAVITNERGHNTTLYKYQILHELNTKIEY